MRSKSSSIIIVLLLIIIVLLVYNIFSQRGKVVNNEKPQTSSYSKQGNGQIKSENTVNSTEKTSKNLSIEELTKESTVVAYVKINGKLPDYYITKQQARKQGWNPAAGNLCDILPGRAIGGDIFTNRERNLPAKKDRVWYEADLNYDCGNRNSDRILFSNDGLIYVTHNHYKTFEKQ